MSHLQHRCDLLRMVRPSIQRLLANAPSIDYTVVIDHTAQCSDCGQWWRIDGSATGVDSAALLGERCSRWWRWSR